MDRKSESDRLDFVEYLTKVAAIVKEDRLLGKWKSVHVVVGNEACDLDSAISALVYAYHLSKVSKDSSKETILFPVLNIPREDYPLKTEVKFALNEEGISGELIVFLEDADWKRLSTSKKLQLTLIDHHIPVGGFAGMEDCVVQVIDHHLVNRDDKRAEYLRKIPATIEAVGSCSTLIAEQLLNDAENPLTSVTAFLLYKTIILDTSSYSKQAGKATQKDVEIGNKLEKLIGGDAKSRDEIFTKLKKAKADVAGMNVTQLLRKDQKLLDIGNSRIIVSSIPVSVHECIICEPHLDDISGMCSDHKVDAIVILGSKLNHKEGIEKGLFIYTKDRSYLESISDGLSTNRTLDLELQPSDLPFSAKESGHSYRYFKQGNVIPSRKQILPLLREILLCRKNSIFNEIPSTATPPNTYIEQGYLGNAESLTEKLKKRVAEVESTQNSTSNPRNPQFDYDTKGRFDPSTPSNTYIEESGAMMKTPQKDQVASMLRNKMAELALDQDSQPVSPLDRSRHHSNDFGQSASSGANTENEHEIFDME